MGKMLNSQTCIDISDAHITPKNRLIKSRILLTSNTPINLGGLGELLNSLRRRVLILSEITEQKVEWRTEITCVGETEDRLGRLQHGTTLNGANVYCEDFPAPQALLTNILSDYYRGILLLSVDNQVILGMDENDRITYHKETLNLKDISEKSWGELGLSHLSKTA